MAVDVAVSVVITGGFALMMTPAVGWIVDIACGNGECSAFSKAGTVSANGVSVLLAEIAVVVMGTVVAVVAVTVVSVVTVVVVGGNVGMKNGLATTAKGGSLLMMVPAG